MERDKTYLITVWGLIQGVGFRPFVYRLAYDHNLRGWVNNTNENVQIAINANPEKLKDFIEQIRLQAPPASHIEAIDCREVKWEEFDDFRILDSESLSDAVTEVSPDIAVCADCLQDMKRQPNRMDYPFLNCTNCGPRFTIVRDLPYDRDHTTMQAFKMCPACQAEYGNPLDRRFHAQPTACRDCGPVYSLVLYDSQKTVDDQNFEFRKQASQMVDHEAIAARTAAIIDRGGIVAVKGLGGFFMACDARNEDAVRRLRASKHREGKPFAVMFRDPDAIREFCMLDPREQEELQSWRRPIVILQNRMGSDSVAKPGQEPDPATDSVMQLAPSVSNGFPTTGAMLPYMPFHYMLFEKVQTPAIVMTSGNLAEEPIMISNTEAEEILGPVSDAILHYNRDIHNRCDDSVGLVVNDRFRLLRRSRGYVPNPVRLDLETEGIFAAGAELVNCFALGKGSQGILSQHIGDLKNFETYEFYRETYERFKRLFRLEPSLVVHDLHPDYLSTRFVKELNLKAIAVQHHHAHIASVMAEHGLNEKVIGVSFDGTGLGDDGNIWGSEFLVCDLEGYERVSHLEYMSMPGGDKATQEPWRMAVSYLYSIYGWKLMELDLPFMEKIDPESLEMVIRSIEKKINNPLTCGAGRLFDAVSALLGICTISSFHAEAPMRLEASIRADHPGDHSGDHDPAGGGRIKDKQAIYPFTAGNVIAVGPIITKIVEDIKNGVDRGQISARFHNTIAAVILETVNRINMERGIRKVCLSGGTFQNKYLSGRIENLLSEAGLEVLVPLQLPANDGGIALGQLAIAARRRSMGLI